MITTYNLCVIGDKTFTICYYKHSEMKIYTTSITSKTWSWKELINSLETFLKQHASIGAMVDVVYHKDNFKFGQV